MVQEMMAHKEFAPIDDMTANRWCTLPFPRQNGTHVVRGQITPEQRKELRGDAWTTAAEIQIAQIPLVGNMLARRFHNYIQRRRTS
jgi:hypothetical protein